MFVLFIYVFFSLDNLSACPLFDVLVLKMQKDYFTNRFSSTWLGRKFFNWFFFFDCTTSTKYCALSVRMHRKISSDVGWTKFANGPLLRMLRNIEHGKIEMVGILYFLSWTNETVHDSNWELHRSVSDNILMRCQFIFQEISNFYLFKQKWLQRVKRTALCLLDNNSIIFMQKKLVILKNTYFIILNV